LAEARRVGREGEEVAVLADVVSANTEELLPLGHLVHVERDLLRRLQIALLAAIDRVLFPLLGACVIEIIALAVRHVLVGLLDTSEHLFVERLLETGG